MRTATLVILAWSMFVGGVTLAAAQDKSEVLYVAPTCRLNAESMARVHAVLCGSDLKCTRKLVKVVCEPTAARKAKEVSK